MTNVLMINTNCSVNKGSAAQVISTTETLSKLFSNANFTLISGYPELDSKLCERHNIKVVGSIRKKPFSKISRFFRLFKLVYYLLRCMMWSALCKIGLKVNKLIEEDILREYSESDLIIDLSGDTLSDKGTYSVFALFTILIGIVLKKKITIFSQSVGPFKKITRPLAKLILNRTDLIIVRENVTKNYLKDMGINNPLIYLAAEIAFLLESAPSERVQEIFSIENIDINEKNCPLICIGGSELTYRGFKTKKNAYVELLAKIVDYLVERFNAKVVFISHVIIPPKYGYFDDRFVAQEIYQLVRNKNGVNIIKGDYSPQELKGIIGKSDLFIGARMHSNIASLSMHVPTIALSWSHKYYGIMKMLEQEKYVCNIRVTSFDELISKIDDAWSNRNEISKKLISKSAEMEKSALDGARLVKKLMDSISIE